MTPESNKINRAFTSVEFNNPEELTKLERKALEGLSLDVSNNMSDPKLFLQTKGIIDDQGKLTESGRAQKTNFLKSLTQEVSGYVSRRGFLISDEKRSQREANITKGYGKLITYINDKVETLTEQDIVSLLTTTTIVEPNPISDILNTISTSNKTKAANTAKKNNDIITKATTQAKSEMQTLNQNSKQANEDLATPKPVAAEIDGNSDTSLDSIEKEVKLATYYVNVRSRLNTRTMTEEVIRDISDTKLSRNTKIEVDESKSLSKDINGSDFDYVRITKIKDVNVDGKNIWVTKKYLDAKIPAQSAASANPTRSDSIPPAEESLVSQDTRSTNQDNKESKDKDDQPEANGKVTETNKSNQDIISQSQTSIAEAIRSTQLKNLANKFRKFEITENGIGGITFQVGSLGYNMSIASNGTKNYVWLNDKNGKNINKFPIDFDALEQAAKLAEILCTYMNQYGGKIRHSNPFEYSLSKNGGIELRFDNFVGLRSGDEDILFSKERGTHNGTFSNSGVLSNQLKDLDQSTIKNIKERGNNLKKPGTNQSVWNNK